MSFDRVSPADEEREWIEKYRAALRQNPVRPSRLSRILTVLTQVVAGKKKVPLDGSLNPEVPRKPINVSSYLDPEQSRHLKRSNNPDLSRDEKENKAS